LSTYITLSVFIAIYYIAHDVSADLTLSADLTVSVYVLVFLEFFFIKLSIELLVLLSIKGYRLGTAKFNIYQRIPIIDYLKSFILQL
jgi:hypothetical protein